MIPALVSSLVLAAVAGAWALLEARDPGVAGDEAGGDRGGCGPSCACRKRAVDSSAG